MEDYGVDYASQKAKAVLHPPDVAPAQLPLDAVLGQLGSELEGLGAQLGKLESRLAGVLGESNPRPEEAPEAPPGSSSVVYLLGQMRNTVLCYRNTLGSILGRLEV